MNCSAQQRRPSSALQHLAKISTFINHTTKSRNSLLRLQLSNFQLIAFKRSNHVHGLYTRTQSSSLTAQNHNINRSTALLPLLPSVPPSLQPHPSPPTPHPANPPPHFPPHPFNIASGSLIPAFCPSRTLFNVNAAISAAPTPLPSSAGKISIGSFLPVQSRISLSATAPRALKCGYLLKTEPSAPTWQDSQPFFLQMAATPQAERRAARVPISSARRRQSSSSGCVAVRESLLAKRSAVSERFSKGSLRGGC